MTPRAAALLVSPSADGANAPTSIAVGANAAAISADGANACACVSAANSRAVAAPRPQQAPRTLSAGDGPPRTPSAAPLPTPPRPIFEGTCRSSDDGEPTGPPTGRGPLPAPTAPPADAPDGNDPIGAAPGARERRPTGAGAADDGVMHEVEPSARPATPTPVVVPPLPEVAAP